MLYWVKGDWDMPPSEKSASEGRHPQRRIAKSSYSLRSCCKKLYTWSKWDQNELYRIKDRNVFNWWSNVPSWMHVQTKDNNAKGKAREATNRPAGQLKAECDFWLLSKDPWSPPGFFHESCMLMYDQHICISVSMNLYYYPTYMCNPIFKIDTINCAARITQGHTLLQLGSKHIMNP